MRDEEDCGCKQCSRETLINCSLSTANQDSVVPAFQHERSQAEDTGDDDGIRTVHEEDAACGLSEMEQVVPWAKLGARIEPHYPKPGKA